jgi:hypothetical protein
VVGWFSPFDYFFPGVPVLLRSVAPFSFFNRLAFFSPWCSRDGADPCLRHQKILDALEAIIFR